MKKISFIIGLTVLAVSASACGKTAVKADAVVDAAEAADSSDDNVDAAVEEQEELGFYGLYNESEGDGFGGYSVKDEVNSTFAYYEDVAEEINYSLENDALTQLDYNFKANDLYTNWDALLNYEWRVLESILDKEEMDSLREEERQWIADKEAAVKAEGQTVEGGSMQPMVEDLEAAKWTKDRVYELRDRYFK